jgi:hypothetical protein
MTFTINHPGRRRNIPLLPALVGLAMTALVMVVAFQLNGAFANNEPAPTAAGTPRSGSIRTSCSSTNGSNLQQRPAARPRRLRTLYLSADPPR